MTKEDIIRMARSAGCHDNGKEFRFVEFRYLERFAALVAAAEREACAELCDRMASRTQDIRSAALEMAAGNIRARGSA